MAVIGIHEGKDGYYNRNVVSQTKEDRMWNRGVMKEYGVHYSYLSEAGNLVLQRPSGVCCTIKGITKYSCLLEMEPTSQRHTLHEMHSALTLSVAPKANPHCSFSLSTPKDARGCNRIVECDSHARCVWRDLAGDICHSTEFASVTRT